MNSEIRNHDLEGFQEFGDVSSLFDFVRTTGREGEKYRDALDGLKLVFDAQEFGLRPSYQDLDLDVLGHRKAEITDIVTRMAGSSKADIKTRAIELMGFLGWEPFLSLLPLLMQTGSG